MQRLKGTTSSELRADYVARYMTPLCAKMLSLCADAQSVIVAVAQYWNDEAEDAVHDHFFPCTSSAPTWPACLDPAINALADEEEDWIYALSYRASDALETELGDSFLRPCSNSDMITAFASYCLEGSSQDMDFKDAYMPYAVVSRVGEGVRVEIVGKIIRPEWEDRFDVGWSRST